MISALKYFFKIIRKVESDEPEDYSRVILQYFGVEDPDSIQLRIWGNFGEILVDFITNLTKLTLLFLVWGVIYVYVCFEYLGDLEAVMMQISYFTSLCGVYLGWYGFRVADPLPKIDETNSSGAINLVNLPQITRFTGGSQDELNKEEIVEKFENIHKEFTHRGVLSLQERVGEIINGVQKRITISIAFFFVTIGFILQIAVGFFSG